MSWGCYKQEPCHATISWLCVTENIWDTVFSFFFILTSSWIWESFIYCVMTSCAYSYFTVINESLNSENVSTVVETLPWSDQQHSHFWCNTSSKICTLFSDGLPDCWKSYISFQLWILYHFAESSIIRVTE